MSLVDPGQAAGALRERLGGVPEVLIVLGSGLGGLAAAVHEGTRVPFHHLPGLPPTGVDGHEGAWVGGELEGRRVLVQGGRYHFYEGHPAEVVSAPVRVAAALGVHTVILTNAAGGIGRGMGPGTLMLVDDHINLMWRSPLTGPVAPGEERFPDMSAPYDRELQSRAMLAAAELRINLLQGTYAAVLGPSYETPAEIGMLERLGAHAVGMSTVPEAMVARALGLRVLAFSIITNRAAGLGSGPTDHEQVTKVGRETAPRLEALIRRVVRDLPT